MIRNIVRIATLALAFSLFAAAAPVAAAETIHESGACTLIGGEEEAGTYKAVMNKGWVIITCKGVVAAPESGKAMKYSSAEDGQWLCPAGSWSQTTSASGQATLQCKFKPAAE